MITGKNEKNFKAWLEKNWYVYSQGFDDTLRDFEQWGVYQKYYDTLDIYISVNREEFWDDFKGYEGFSNKILVREKSKEPLRSMHYTGATNLFPTRDSAWKDLLVRANEEANKKFRK